MTTIELIERTMTTEQRKILRGMWRNLRRAKFAGMQAVKDELEKSFARTSEPTSVEARGLALSILWLEEMGRR